ncbi:MAG: S-layer homology domain-containing protein [Magnetococcales bacterium]|nr:S-layer homology domain-containing protein [Magnetococcales bacterium]
MNDSKRLSGLLLSCFFLLAFTLSGCVSELKSPPVVVQEPLPGLVEEAWQDYAEGMFAMEAAHPGRAERKFDSALSRVGTFSPALVGKSLIFALKAAEKPQGKQRRDDEKAALAWLAKAETNLHSQPERFVYHVGAIRLYFALRSPGWINLAFDHYRAAWNGDGLDGAFLPYYQNRYAASYFMGVAKYVSDFRQAEPFLEKVLVSQEGGRWSREAGILYEKIQEILRSVSYHSLSGTALDIAIRDEVTRGEIAALLVTELALDPYFAKGGRTSVQTVEPVDLFDHPYRNEILTLSKWQIKGLSPLINSTTGGTVFDPDILVDRKGLALILEDILQHIRGAKGVAGLTKASQSPFPDVSKHDDWFGAVRVVTAGGLMKPDLTGAFRPDGPVSGANLLLAVMTLKNEIQ